jgi:hypothetical protein
MDILKKNHSGQVALVMVLIMTVISAVAVSVAGRSTVETRVQEMDAESASAMLAAQSGLEQAVGLQGPLTGTLAEGKNFAVSVVSEGTTGVISEKINAGETFDVSITGATGISGARIYFKPANPSEVPSLFVSDVRSDRTIDYAFDTTGLNGFTKVITSGSLNGVIFDYVTASPVTLSLASSQSLRITVLGAAAFLGIEPVGGDFPPQTRNFKAVGDVGTSGTKVMYGIEYKESVTDKIPSVFDYALFSNGSIIQ